MTETRRPKAVPTVQIDNPRTRVTEWRFAPGAETGWHRHEMDYIVVPMTSGTLLLETDEGSKSSALRTGESYYRDKGARHNVVNANDHEFVFIETEVR